MKKKILVLFIMGILLCQVTATRIGVVVRYPATSEFTECVSVPEGTNGYDVLEKTGLDIEWSYNYLYGHSLCKIEDTGCPSSNCWCGGDSYWGFFIKEYGEDSWTYSPVGFDGGSSCWNKDPLSWGGHYCAEPGGIIGLAYGTYGTEPTIHAFRDICDRADIDNNGTVSLDEVIDMIDLWSNGIIGTGEVIDAIIEWVNS